MSYTYDTLNRLSTVVDNASPGQNTTAYAYDTASNLVTVTDPNKLQSTIQYDSMNRLTSLNTATQNSSAVAGYSYTSAPWAPAPARRTFRCTPLFSCDAQ